MGAGCFCLPYDHQTEKETRYPSQAHLSDACGSIESLAFPLDSNQAYRAISTGQLNALLRFTISGLSTRWSYLGPQELPCLEAGLSPLRLPFTGYPFTIIAYPALLLANKGPTSGLVSPRSSRTRGKLLSSIPTPSPAQPIGTRVGSLTVSPVRS